MTQILLTSSILIGVIGFLRLILRRWVSKRLIYATWLLVALRLLIPFQFGQSEYSVAAVAEKLEQRSAPIQQVQQQLQKPMSGPSQEEIYQKLMADYLSQSQPQTAPTQTPQPEPDIAPSVTVPPEVHQQLSQQAEDQISAPTLAQLLTSIWIGGIILMAGWFLLSNAIFLRRARRAAQPCEDTTAPIPVRISGNVTTPCLAGLFRPVIYLTPASAADPQIRHHVLTHELTHLRHLDHVWAWVRCLCLCIYWFHPLVWIAAMVSKRDCELACDEAALKKLGDHQRIAYGKTLLATVTHSPTHVFHAATAMSETKKQLKERVNFIVKKPKNLLIAAVCLILAVTLTAGLVFTGCKSEPEPTTPTTSTEPPAPTQPDSPAPQKQAPTEESLLQLLQDAADIVATKETIKLNAYNYVNSYVRSHHITLYNPQALTITDDYILIHTHLSLGTVDWTKVYVYAVFLDLLLDQYAEDITPSNIQYDPTYSSQPKFPVLFLYTGWQEAGYDSIQEYYSAINDGVITCPPDSFYINYDRPQIKSTQYDSQNLWEQLFPPVDISPGEPSDTLSIAEKAVDDYLWYNVVGVCCDYEYVNADMSRYLTDAQKENYFNVQYKLSCCHTADEVRNHIDRCIGAELQTCGYPDDRLFTDNAGNLYLIVTPTDYNGYRHSEVLSESDDAISVRTCQYDEDGCYLSLIFSLNATDSGYQVTAVTQDNDYKCTPQIVDQGPTYMVLKYGPFSYGYQLYDTDGSLKVNVSTGSHYPTVTPLSTHVTEIMLNYGTGITRRFYWDARTLTRSDSYDYVVAASPQKIAYLDGDLDNRTLVVCDIFDRSTAQTFTDLGIYADVMPVIAATFSEDGTELEITYYTAKNTKKTVTLNLTI